MTAAPQERVTALKARMGWDMRVFTLVGDEFPQDFGVEEMLGLIVLIRDGDRVYQTYFVNGRGIDCRQHSTLTARQTGPNPVAILTTGLL